MDWHDLGDQVGGDDLSGRGVKGSNRLWTKGGTHKIHSDYPPARHQWLFTLSARHQLSCGAESIGIVPPKEIRGRALKRETFERVQASGIGGGCRGCGGEFDGGVVDGDGGGGGV